MPASTWAAHTELFSFFGGAEGTVEGVDLGGTGSECAGGS